MKKVFGITDLIELKISNESGAEYSVESYRKKDSYLGRYFKGEAVEVRLLGANGAKTPALAINGKKITDNRVALVLEENTSLTIY